MIRVRFRPSDLTGKDLARWNRWVKRASAERTKCLAAHKAGHAYEFNDRIWGYLKGFFLKTAFNDKCGYCESYVEVVMTGAADHYRPKKRVSVRGSPPVMCGKNEHPGYYWLAYEWRNLIPACNKCNTSGKGTQFPVKNVHGCSPTSTIDDLDRDEDPLLLNPHREGGNDVLLFDERGKVTARDGSKNEKGLKSIDVYNLDREPLQTARQEAQELAWTRWSKAYADRDRAKMKEVLDKYGCGMAPYSLACWQWIHAGREEETKLVEEPGEP
jgi:hypothetical protein